MKKSVGLEKNVVVPLFKQGQHPSQSTPENEDSQARLQRDFLHMRILMTDKTKKEAKKSRVKLPV